MVPDSSRSDGFIITYILYCVDTPGLFGSCHAEFFIIIFFAEFTFDHREVKWEEIYEIAEKGVSIKSLGGQHTSGLYNLHSVHPPTCSTGHKLHDFSRCQRRGLSPRCGGTPGQFTTDTRPDRPPASAFLHPRLNSDSFPCSHIHCLILRGVTMPVDVLFVH